MYFSGHVIFGYFESLKREAVRGQIFKRMGAGVRRLYPLLGEVIRIPVRLSCEMKERTVLKITKNDGTFKVNDYLTLAKSKCGS